VREKDEEETPKSFSSIVNSGAAIDRVQSILLMLDRARQTGGGT